MKSIFLSALMFVVVSPAWAAPAPSQQKKTKATTPSKPAKPKPAARSQALHGLFQRANQQYNNGQYREAAQMLEKLVASKEWAHFAVFYNLGNTYVRLQRYGLALAYYRKAQRLRPNHLNLLHNVQTIYRRLGKTNPHQGAHAKFLFWYYLLDLKWTFYAVVFFTSFALFLWAVYIRRKTRGWVGLRWPLATLGTFALLMWLSFGIKLYQERYVTSGIIVEARVTARSGYGDQFEPLFRLTETDDVTVKEQITVSTPSGKQKWCRVEATFYSKKEKRRIRKVGWIPARAIKTI